ncbi:MAG: hypothetical protein ACYTGN_00485 [Planctomycetota bacterium]|jgi:hypothetical protein
MADSVRELQEEFAEREEQAYLRLTARQRKNRRNATIAGAAIGLAAVIVTVGVTRRAIFWHSFLLDALLGAAAGYTLVRLNGGFMKGLLLFAGAYLLAFGVRALGLDPSVLFHYGDIRGAAAIQGNMASLSFTIAAGGLVGMIVQE